MHHSVADSRIRWHAWFLILIVAVGLAAYSNSFFCPFIFDDILVVVKNPNIRSLWPPWDIVLVPSHMEPLAHRPIISLSLALNYAWGGLISWGYHVVNLAVHLLAGLVLFGIVRRTFLTDRLRKRYGQNAAWLALVVALLWIAHPLQTGSITYITQRAESVMGLFYLLTVYCVIRSAHTVHKKRWENAAIVFCALGMSSKETMGTAPFVALMYDTVFLAKSFRQAFGRRLRLYVGLAATWLVLGALVMIGPELSSVGFHAAQFSPIDYLLMQSGVIIHYLRLALWPYPLVLDYFGWPLATNIGAIWPSVTVVLVLLIGTFWCLRHKPALGFVGGWFFLILGPSSIWPMPTEIAAEHRMYLPLVSVVVLVVVGVYEGIQKFPNSCRFSFGITAILVSVMALGATTIRRNQDYQSGLIMWTDIATKRPDNPKAHYSLGVYLGNQGRAEEAITRFKEAIRLKPDYPDAHYNLGVALARKGQFDQAVASYIQALNLKPSHTEAHFALGLALVELDLREESISHFAEALRLASADDQKWKALAASLNHIGILEQVTTRLRYVLDGQEITDEISLNNEAVSTIE